MSIVELAHVNPDELWNEPYLQEAIDVWKINEAEQVKLREVQRKIQNDIPPHPWNDPHVLLAYADDSKGCWKTAERRFRRMMDWRKRNNIDSLLTDYVPHPLLLDNSPIAFLKDGDKDGDPIYLERGGALDLKGLLKRFPKDEVWKHAIWLREVQCSGVWLEQHERRLGRPIKDVTVIYDLQGLCGRHLAPNVLSFFQKLMDATEEYYPGPVKRVIVIRSPHIFRRVWAIVKHFFKEEDRQKMIFAESDYLSELSKWMDLDVLPPCINPNGHGETAVGMPKRMEGGKIPSHIGKGGAGYVSPYGTSIESLLSTGGQQQPATPTKDFLSIEEPCSSTDEEESDVDDEQQETKLTTKATTCESDVDNMMTVAATC